MTENLIEVSREKVKQLMERPLASFGCARRSSTETRFNDRHVIVALVSVVTGAKRAGAMGRSHGERKRGCSEDWI